ncbi:MAG: ribonuclease III, partial [Saprospiraceae bacterium]|nr:ribonuclease III [Saprospiraceae bacterium]
MRYFFISSYYRFIYKIKKALGFTSALEDILGFTIKRKDLYKEAFIHRSVSTTTNNERLEFLGDSVLQSIVSHYIFRKFPTFKEGELTVLRSKIVRRKTLNKIGEELG